MRRRHWIPILAALAVLLWLPAMASAKVLKIATWEDVNTFDPGWMTSAERELAIMTCLYDGLVRYKPGTWEVQPALATSWDISKDGKQITFHLRKGVQFHKGYGEVTAEDVKFSFERVADPKNKSPEKSAWSKLDRVEVVDRYTVKLIFKAPMVNLFDSVLPMNTGMIVSKKAVEKAGREKFAFAPIGTGPYELVSWEPKKQIRLKAFNGYWGAKPKAAEITVIPIVEDATCETALKTGEVDVGRSSMINLKSFEKNPKFQVVRRPAMKTYWLGLTVNKPPFDDLKLRQAFRYAVDVDKIVEAAFFGVATRANTILPPGVPGRWEDAPVYKQDIDKAKHLIEEAGKADGFDVTLYIPATDVERVMAEVIKADAAKAGINVTIEIKEQGAFNEGINKGEPNAYIQFYTSTTDPDYIMRWFAGDSWNPSQWHNPKYAELIAKGTSEIDPAKRAQIYIEAQKLIDQDAWAIWLTHGVKFWIAQSTVDMGKVYPNGRLAPWTMGFK